MLCRLSPATTAIRFEGLRTIAASQIRQLLTTNPHDMKAFWKVLRARYASYTALEAVKSLLRFLCDFQICGWNTDLWIDLSQLALPKVDKFAAVRSGDVFLTVQEEAELVTNVDRFTEVVRRRPAEVSDRQLQSTAMLICSFRFGLRPKQIAMLKMRDVRIRQDATDGSFAVYLTFMMIKQHSADRRLPMTRRINREPMRTNLLLPPSSRGFSAVAAPG
jgi:hypothetical protein